MTSRIFDPRQDTTMKNRHAGTGSSATMLCWTCNKPKSRAGAKQDPKTRFFNCAACSAPKVAA